MRIRSLRSRFIVSGCLLLAAIVVCGAWSVTTINRFGTALGDTLDQHQATINIAVELILSLEREDDALLMALRGNKVKATEDLRKERTRFDEDYAALKDRLETAEDRDAYVSLRTYVDVYREIGDALLLVADQPGAFDLYYQQVNSALRDAVAGCRYFRQANVDAMQREGVEAREDARRSSLALGGIAFGAFLASAVVLAGLTQSVMQPLGEIGQAVDAIRKDDLDARVLVRSADELGVLAEGFNRMADALAKYRHEAEDRFRQLAENIHEIFWISDAKHERILYVSPGYEEVWGRTCKSVYEQPSSWIEHIHPDDREGAIANLKQRLHGTFSEAEYRIVRPDASFRWVRSRAFPINDPDGNLSRIAGLVEDITERKQAEEEREALMIQFRLLLESTDQGIHGLDLEGHCTFINRANAAMLGYTPEEILGRSMHEMIHHTRSDGSAYPKSECPIYHVLREGPGCRLSEEVLWRKDGSSFPAEYSSFPIIYEGRRLGAVVTLTDISQHKRVEQELRMAKELAEGANRAKDEFLANVSHEIRTPMNAILGMTELALDTQLPDNLRQYLKTVKSAADNLLNIINDLLDFSKIEAGKLELAPEEFSLQNVIGDTLRALAVRAHHKGLELVCHIRSDVVDGLVGDAGRLRQVLLNLVGNAVKFTTSGEVVVEVEVGDVDLPEQEIALRFSVRDTGIGISPDKQQTIFQAFEQEDTSTTRRYGGTGLGLTIAARLVDLMGGTIEVESEVGRGSTFRFTARFHRQVERVGSASQPMADLPPNLRVLIVDDNVTNRRILEEWLGNWRMNATARADGAAAMETLLDAADRREPYELMLLDGRMPGIDGLELAAQVRRRSEIASLPIILLSSGDRPGDVARARELHLNAHLRKPVQQSELLETIQRVMSRACGEVAPTLPRSGESELAVVSTMESKSNSTPLRILVAEDNEFNAQLLEQLVRQKGHEVRIADNGRTALSLAQSGDFDLLFLDIHMPELDGYQVVQAIREGERTTGGRLPVVALTASSREEDRLRCFVSGMDDFLGKPIRAAELRATIDRYAALAAATKDLPDEQSLIDPQAVLAACGDDAEILAGICEAFQTHFPEQLAAVHDALRAGDAPRLREAAHRLQGVIGAFSSIGAEVTSQLEDEAAAGNLDTSRSFVERLTSIADKLAPSIGRLTIEGLRKETSAD